MNQGDNGREADEDKDAAEKLFEAMWTDVRQLRRVIEDMAAAQAKAPRAPDYAPTLGKIMADMAAIANSPLLRVSYNDVARQVASAGEQVKRESSLSIDASTRALAQAAAELRALSAGAWTARVQNWALGIAVMFGILLWAGLEGSVLRAAPKSLEWPEKAAARLMGLPMWDAGMELAAKGQPETFRRVGAADRLVRANAKVIEACQKAAEKAGKPVPCTLKVPAAEKPEDGS